MVFFTLSGKKGSSCLIKHTYEKQLCESERGRWELWKVCSRAACTVHYSFTSSDIYWYKSLSLFIWKPLQFNVLCIFKQCLVFVENIYNLKQCYLTVAVLPYTKTIFHRQPTICFALNVEYSAVFCVRSHLDRPGRTFDIHISYN